MSIPYDIYIIIININAQFNIKWVGISKNVLPSVSFEVFQLDPQHVFIVAGKHVNVFIAHPKFLCGIAKSIFIIGPVPVEVFTYRIADVVSSLNDLYKIT